jgi:phosphatidylglycerophosphatase A
MVAILARQAPSFSEEKEAKRLLIPGSGRWHRQGPQSRKSFLVLFFKKNCLLRTQKGPPMDAPKFIASGGGAGYAPRAPGTFGSLVGLIIGGVLLHFGHAPLLISIMLVSGAGLWAINQVGGGDDAGWIVIDEIAGQMIAVLALPYVSLAGLVLAFGLFRLFDITKWGPIGILDRRHDALGVMGDDWVAGGFAFICVFVILLLFPGPHG